MNVLAVEEDWWDRKQLKRLLKKAVTEAEIYVFDNYDEALAFAQNSLIDAAFIDFGKSIHNPGFFLAKKILNMQKTNIIFTNYEWEHLQEAFELRVSGYIQKPLQYEDVLEEFENLRYPLVDGTPSWTDASNNSLMPTPNMRCEPHNRFLSKLIRFFH